MLVAMAHVMQVTTNDLGGHFFQREMGFGVGRVVMDEVQRVQVVLGVVFFLVAQFIAKPARLSERSMEIETESCGFCRGFLQGNFN
jgi:hypothetical protein